MALVNCAASLTPNFSPRSCSRYASQAVPLLLIPSSRFFGDLQDGGFDMVRNATGNMLGLPRF